MTLKNIILLAGTTLLFFTCNDVIEVDLEESGNQLVVDGWITDQPHTQTIRLLRTSPYFDSSPSPAETGATVIVTGDDGSTYNFNDEDNDGNYNWHPVSGETLGEVGVVYTLSITTSDNKEYTAVSPMKRVPPIDSITYENRTETELGEPPGRYAELWVRDFPGAGDSYWIKTYKNGVFLSKPQEMVVAYDAAFTPGGGVDGDYFIVPIRQSINRVSDGNDSADNDDVPPWAIGDSIHVEVLSINDESYYFLNAVFTQMTLGDASIFAEPPANVPTNIVALNATETRDQPVGFFNVSAVSEMGLLVDE